LERQFQNFLEYVPYLEGNEKTYSFKLLNLVLSIGGHVDSAFKEMAHHPDFSDNKHCQTILEIIAQSNGNIKAGKAPRTVPISLSLKAFAKDFRISEEAVIFKRLTERELVVPFKPYNLKTKAPEWWEIYNGLKHDVSLNIKKANLQNTVHALAGALLLNVRHTPGALKLYDSGLLRVAWTDKFAGKPACEEILRDQIKDMLGEASPCFVETPLFIYNYGRGQG